ncbi:MAG: hypothetical protein A3F13_02060 [Gammaproteobacteria bacterium RIFCSPHIGHO2_12_FULL_40_19]|nr:MAG: hypothetical protein A3F13_02060 [Gammaproteobacteria bacterium RIFCSPHIGHO2_12_FULL_40_19]
MIELSNHFTGTYAKNLLADWTVLTQLIRQQTAWVKDTINVKNEMGAISPLLTDQQMNDALNGPFQQFFKPHLQAYAAIAKIETALTISKEESFKESEHNIPNPLGIPDTFLAKMEFSTLKELHNKLVALTQEHHTAWESEIQNWTKSLLQELKKNNLTLSDLELQDFTINQPISELNDRFLNLKIAFPKLSKTDFDFAQYYTLKAMLAIHSALSRSQMPNTEAAIEKIVKTLHPTLKSIHKTEKVISQAQEKALKELTASVIV